MTAFFGTNKFEKFSNMLILLILFLSFCYLIWPANLWPIKCFEIKSVEILTPVVSPGDDITYKVTYEKFTDRPAMVSRQILDDRIFNFVDVPSNVSKGHDSVINTIRLPITASVNKPHTLVWSVSYELPFRKVTYQMVSPEFSVVEKK